MSDLNNRTWELFKAYAFWKVSVFGILLLGIGILSIVITIYNKDGTPLICGIPSLIIGTVVLFIALRLWTEEDEKETNERGSHTVGSFRPHEEKTCPKCGGEHMAVYHDNSGTCRDCGYTRGNYHKDLNTEASA